MPKKAKNLKVGDMLRGEKIVEIREGFAGTIWVNTESGVWHKFGAEQIAK